MKFSTQEEYGLRCLIAVGKVGPEGSATIPEISRKEGLSEAHVAKLLMIMRKDGFINSTRGHAGGYALARPASQIVLGEVLASLGGKLVEEDFCERHSGQNDICTHSQGCTIKSLWSKVQVAVDSVINNITLEDILRESTGGELVQLQSTRPERRALTAEVHA